MKLINTFVKTHYFYLIVFVFALLFFLLTPLTGDDFTWTAYYRTLERSGDFLSSFPYLYENINGRVIGNALELFLVDHSFIASVVRALVILGIVLLLVKLLQPKTTVEKGIIALLVLFPSLGIFRQTIVWSAGFYNYVVPIFMLLATYTVLQKAKKSWYHYAGIVTLATASCLFVENISIVVFLLTGAWLAYNTIKERKLDTSLAAAFAGVIIGCGVMFSSPVYANVIQGNDNYRQVAGESTGMIETVVTNASHLSQFVVFDMLYIYAIILGLVVLYLFRQKHLSTYQTRYLPGVAIGSLLLLALLSGVKLQSVGLKFEAAYTGFVLAIFAVFLICLIAILYKTIDRSSQKFGIIGCLLTGLLFAAPLLVVSPFGSRNFYITHVLFLIAIVLLIQLTGAGVLAKLKTWLYGAAMIMAVGVLCVFVVVKYVELKNTQLANQQLAAGKTTITLKKYPFKKLLHNSEAGNKHARTIGQYDCLYVECGTDREIKVLYK